MPRLATTFRVIAPDLPGFGFTEIPAGRNYEYRFDNLAETTDAFVQLPAASIPCGLSTEKMPIGLQIIGRPFDEATVLKVADAYERHTRWHLECPAISN